MSSVGVIMKLNEFFNKNPVFTLAELDRFLSQKGTGNQATRNALLSYYRQRGRIISVRRSLYAVVPVGTSAETFAIDPFLLAAKMNSDATLAYHTALEFHGKAYSVFNRFFYLANRVSVPVNFRNYEFKCVLMPRALQKKHKHNFEVEKVERSGIEIKVTSLERTLVDVLDRPDISGSWEEIWRSLESIEFFDISQVIEYTLLLENSTTAAKVGFFLDQHREKLMIKDGHLEPLIDLKPRQPHYLERSKRKSGRFISTWNIVVPDDLIDHSWKEVF